MKRIVAAVALVLVLFAAAHTAVVAAPETRVALVIGNSAYNDAPLANPVNDARLMAETLRGLGFDVIERTDATQREMKLAIFELGDRLEAAGKDAVGLFFYAGHGVQVDGQNYLIPLNAEISKERHVAIEAVGAGWVLSQMEFAGNRVNFVILDACRNNPLTRGFRSQLRGLAKMNAPTGSLVAYSTGPGDVAVDGDGANSPYTLALSQAMRMPNLPAEKVFKLVRDAVREATNDEQTPWEESSMTGADFYFKIDVSVTVGTTVPTTPSATDTEATERLFWETIKDSSDPAMFDAYLQQFPIGTFAGVARLKRDALGASSTDETKTATIVPPPSPTSEIQDFKYLGCFKDGGAIFGTEGRDLSGYTYMSRKLTVKLCVERCRSKGFRYAGTQWMDHCFCGNTYGKFGPADNCNLRCRGNPSDFCGGGWANSVFEVGQP